MSITFPSGSAVDYTSQERGILAVLADGMAHKRIELTDVLKIDNDNISVHNRNVRVQASLTNLRRKLREIGQDIICEYRCGTFYYRQIILLVRFPLSAEPLT